MLDRGIKHLLLLAALISLVSLFLIAFFTLSEGWRAFFEVGLGRLLFGTEWRPTLGEFGFLPMIIGSLAVTFGALLFGVPLALACAIFLAEVAPPKVHSLVRRPIELLAGIPSVVYGLFGVVALAPLIRELGGSGLAILTGSIILAIMILPIVTTIAEDSLRAVPLEYKEGSLALGATRLQTIWRVSLPTASSGIMAGIILGMGRAIGETMAMIMVLGNTIHIPTSPLDSARTLTGNIALEIKYAAGLHESALFATGVLLFAFIMLITSVARILSRRRVG